jgi:hypothetical protein
MFARATSWLVRVVGIVRFGHVAPRNFVIPEKAGNRSRRCGTISAPRGKYPVLEFTGERFGRRPFRRQPVE